MKTSILILDKQFAKSGPPVLFSKVHNIGVSLGMKRTLTESNDLPHVVSDYAAYYAGRSLSAHSWLADRSAVLADDSNLSGDRYRPLEARADTRLVSLGEVCSMTRGAHSSTKSEPGAYPLIVTAQDWLTSCDYELEGDAVCVPLISSTGHGRASIKRIHFVSDRFAVANLLVALQPRDPEVLDAKFLYLVLNRRKGEMAALMNGAANVGMKVEDLAAFRIPLPSLAAQREVVAQIEAYQGVVDGAQSVLDHYQPHISVDPEWPFVRLGDHFSTSSGGTPSKGNKDFWIGEIPWVSPKDMKSDVIVDTLDHLSDTAVADSAMKVFPADTVVCVVRSGILKHTFPVALLSRSMCINQDLIALRPKDEAISPRFLLYLLKTESSAILTEGIKPGVTVQSFYKDFFKDYQVPLPPLAVQERVVQEIEVEQALVAGSRQLIARFEVKIEAVLNQLTEGGSLSAESE